MNNRHSKRIILAVIYFFTVCVFLFGCTKQNTEQNDSVQIASKEDFVCTLSVRCDTAIGKCPEKEEIIPQNGIIYPESIVNFSEGESVFDILQREMINSKIHLEFNETPLYKTAYIEGIGNLYEFDCGELSGWMYRVNGEFPGVGCSSCYVKNGDVIEFMYSCDLGEDLGKGK